MLPFDAVCGRPDNLPLHTNQLSRCPHLQAHKKTDTPTMVVQTPILPPNTELDGHPVARYVREQDPDHHSQVCASSDISVLAAASRA